MKLQHDEFHLSIRWRTPDKGSYPRPATPGFYCNLGWSNEGEAFWQLQNRKVDFAALRHIVAAVCDALKVTHIDGYLMHMQAAYDYERRQRLTALKEKQKQTAAAIAELESEV